MSDKLTDEQLNRYAAMLAANGAQDLLTARMLGEALVTEFGLSMTQIGLQVAAQAREANALVLPEEPTFTIPEYPSKTFQHAGDFHTLPWDDWVGLRLRAITFKQYAASLRAVAQALAERNGRLVEKLNHAVSALTNAAMNEDFDSNECMEVVELIKDEFATMGKTPDWHTMVDWYDRLCAAMGVDNGDEINILPLVEKRLKELAERVKELEHDIAFERVLTAAAKQNTQRVLTAAAKQNTRRSKSALADARGRGMEEAANMCDAEEARANRLEDERWADSQKQTARAIRALAAKGWK